MPLTRRNRNGLTLIELIVVVAILAILCGVLFVGLGGTNYYRQANSGTYECVKTYTYTSGSSDSASTQKRVDLRPVGGGPVETVICDDSVWAGVSNSATLYAQFEAGKTYDVTTVGYRREGFVSVFPTVTSVRQVAVK